MQQESIHLTIRNPFGTMDVPAPDSREVQDYAATVVLGGEADDLNAAPWSHLAPSAFLDGTWASRWNGGADPTIPGDAPDKWKTGQAEVRVVGGRVYLRFDWDGGRRHGLIDSRREGADRLVGKYVNLTTPSIVAPWVGLIVNPARIDGRFPYGRIDFRR